MPYTIAEHKHRFSAWAAARAASTSKKCKFKVKEGKRILEDIGLDANFTVHQIPATAKDFDAFHKELRDSAVIASNNLVGFSHGVAAKLLNIYFKARFVCACDEHNARILNIHPPIDRVLLDELIKKRIGNTELWKEVNSPRVGGWSGMASAKYQEVINEIRKCCNEKAFWEIEKHWVGHQHDETD